MAFRVQNFVDPVKWEHVPIWGWTKVGKKMFVFEPIGLSRRILETVRSREGEGCCWSLIAIRYSFPQIYRGFYSSHNVHDCMSLLCVRWRRLRGVAVHVVRDEA